NIPILLEKIKQSSAKVLVHPPALVKAWGVRVIRQVKALSSDSIKPRYRVTYFLTSDGPRTVRVRYACGGEANEDEIVLSKTMRYVVELVG
ncbi:MAG: hypothetical protein ACP5GZ_12085, partial [Vulcanisaeta sp.]